jgi:hypothetical protein
MSSRFAKTDIFLSSDEEDYSNLSISPTLPKRRVTNASFASSAFASPVQKKKGKITTVTTKTPSPSPTKPATTKASSPSLTLTQSNPDSVVMPKPKVVVSPVIDLQKGKDTDSIGRETIDLTDESWEKMLLPGARLSKIRNRHKLFFSYDPTVHFAPQLCDFLYNSIMTNRSMLLD